MDNPTTPTCPFCPFSDSDTDFVAQHIEFCHPDTGPAWLHPDEPPATTDQGPLPFSVDEDLTDKYVDCPHGCGETVPSTELSTHLDLHLAEGLALEDSAAAQTSPDINLTPEEDDLIPEDDEVLQDLPEPSRKGRKRGLERDFSRANPANPPRTRSPPRTVGADGVKRLGVILLNSWTYRRVDADTWLARRAGSTRP